MTIPAIYSKSNPDLTPAPALPVVATLMTMGQDIMRRLNACAAGAGAILPDRQVVFMTTVPLDCEQVMVAFQGWVPDIIPDGMTICGAFRWAAQFGVGIARCTPALPDRGTTTAPKVEKMYAAAQMASDDAELLLALLSTFDEIGPDVNVNTPAPEGGFQVVTLTVTLPAFGGLD